MASGAVHRFIYLSDIAGSSRLAEAYPEVYRERLAQHNALIEQAVAAHGGSIYKNTGDGYFALFETARGLTDCARELALSFCQFEPFSSDDQFRVRIALHAGELHPSGAEYFGPPLNRVSRICQVCNAGQVLLSGPVAAALNEGELAEAMVKLADLGEHHLRDLADPEHLYQLDHPGFGQHQFPPLATLNNRPNNLVEQPNRFIGRVRELQELETLLCSGQRLVTIIAPGGYGKSRLAAQLCANLLPQFERGCFMVYLAPLRESLDVPMAIGNALGYQFSAGRTPEQQLCDYLRGKELLLCLDNMEHMLECAPLVAEILRSAQKVKIVVTAREPLRIEGEVFFWLEPLSVAAGSDERSDAAKLFADRARLVRAAFVMDEGNYAQVQAICTRLSGIPLAIELAAAWMDSFTLKELLDELGGQIELEARSSDKPERHQSLKACLDWSWNLLGGAQQELLMRLSVFRGGFFADAAAAVLNLKGMALRAALGKLCDKSWLYTREVDTQTRFFLRDMLAHEYAFAKLEETQDAESAWARAPLPGQDGRLAGAPASMCEFSLYESAVRAHAAYFAALTEREGPRLNGGGTPDGGKAQMQALRTLRHELQNIEEALDSALKRGILEWLLPIATYLRLCYGMGSAYFTQQSRYAQLLSEADSLGDLPLMIRARLGLGIAQARLGRYAEASDLLERAQSLAQECGDRHGEAALLGNLAVVCDLQGDFTKAEELQSQALTIRREVGDRQGEASSLSNLALIYHMDGDYAKAEELHSQALEIGIEIGDCHGVASSLSNLGLVYHKQGDLARAQDIHGKALAIRREIGDRHGEAISLGNLTLVHYAQADYASAELLLSQTLAIRREIGDRQGEAMSLGNLAHVHAVQGEYAEAEELQGKALAIRREIGDRLGAAYSLGNLADLYQAQGDCLRAAEGYRQSLTIFREIKAKVKVCSSCTNAAVTLCALQALRRAAVALHGGLAQATALNYHFDPDEQMPITEARARLDAAVASGEITVEQLADWQAEGEAMSLDELADSVLAALNEVAGHAA